MKKHHPRRVETGPRCRIIRAEEQGIRSLVKRKLIRMFRLRRSVCLKFFVIRGQASAAETALFYLKHSDADLTPAECLWPRRYLKP